jgi:hypothetical protein
MAKAPDYVTTAAIEVVQNGQRFYLCAISAKTLSTVARVNMRDPEKDTGYQRLFVESHINNIRKYLEGGRCIPVSMLSPSGEQSS